MQGWFRTTGWPTSWYSDLVQQEQGPWQWSPRWKRCNSSWHSFNSAVQTRRPSVKNWMTWLSARSPKRRSWDHSAKVWLWSREGTVNSGNAGGGMKKTSRHGRQMPWLPSVVLVWGIRKNVSSFTTKWRRMCAGRFSVREGLNSFRYGHYWGHCVRFLWRGEWRPGFWPSFGQGSSDLGSHWLPTIIPWWRSLSS